MKKERAAGLNYEVTVQLGRIDISERQVTFDVLAQDAKSAYSQAMCHSVAKFKERFGADNPINNKYRNVIAVKEY